LKEITLISDKGGTGRSTIMECLQQVYYKNSVFADCSFSKIYPQNKIISEELFSDSKEAVVNNDNCLLCGKCENICEFNALRYDPSGIEINSQKCNGCSCCVFICPTEAIKLKNINCGKIIVTRNQQNSVIVYGINQHFSHNGTRPVLQIRNKAIIFANDLNLDFCFIESNSGWNKLTRSLMYYSKVIVPVVEPHQFVFDFLNEVSEFCFKNHIEVKLIINKYDLNANVTNKIIKCYNKWKIICIPWNDSTDGNINKYLLNII